MAYAPSGLPALEHRLLLLQQMETGSRVHGSPPTRRVFKEVQRTSSPMDCGAVFLLVLQSSIFLGVVKHIVTLLKESIVFFDSKMAIICQISYNSGDLADYVINLFYICEDKIL